MVGFSKYLPAVSKSKRVLGGVVLAHKRAGLAKREFESLEKTGMVMKGKPIITNKRFLKFLSFSSKFSKGAQELR